MASKGFNCTLSVGGSTVGKAQEVSPSLEADEQDITTREDAPWDNWQQGRKRLTADITGLWVGTASGIQALEDAWFNDSDLDAQLSRPDGSGYSATCGVLSLSGAQNMDDAVTLDISIKSKGQVSQSASTS